MSKLPEVVICCDGIFPEAVGGMQRHSALLIEYLARLELAKIHVIHPHAKKLFTSLPQVDEHALDFNFEGNYLKSCYDYSKKVKEKIDTLSYDVIYSQGFSVWNGISEIGTKVIINPHGLEPFQGVTIRDRLTTLPMRMIEKYLFRKASKVVSLGGQLTKILNQEAGVPNAKIVILPNAVAAGTVVTKTFHKEPFQLLFVGRFAHNKGIHLLMEAVQKLNTEGYKNRLHLHLVGKGPLYDQYTKLNTEDNITFHGFADEKTLKALYQDCDLFVFPTLFEGMPTVVLEAMAQGMPVVVSDTGATAELVDGRNGFLIEKNNVRALKMAIQTFCMMDEYRQQELSAACIRKVNDHFTWDVVAARHAQLFKTYCKEK